jgi:hypothetical protein
MKTYVALVLISLLVSVSTIISLPLANGEPLIGVKKGDWIEYDINISGTPPPIHNVTWMKMEVLQVQGAALDVNLTNRFANGTLSSSIWKFNFTEGQTEGWLIIPSGLSPGDTFYDASKIANITIQGQKQKIVVDAARTITFANDSFKIKEWDKATGVFTQSSENLRNWSAYVYATSTNMWSPQIQGIAQTEYFAITVFVMVAVVIVAIKVAFVKKDLKKGSEL